MTDKDKPTGSNIFDIFAARMSRKKGSADSEYLAYLLDDTGEAKWFKVYYENGLVGMFPYGELLEIISSDDAFALMFSFCILTLEGENLDHLLDYFQTERVQAIGCFVEGNTPPPEGQPIITAIHRESLEDVLENDGQ